MSPGWRATLAALGLALLAGCGSGSAGWVRGGADEAATAREYRDCRELAATATSVDADIDQDIMATRGSDRERSSVVRRGTDTMRETTRDRAAAIVASCMRAKGFSNGR